MTRKSKAPAYRREYYAANLDRERAARRDSMRRRRANYPSQTRAYAASYRKRNPWPSRRCAWRQQGVDVVAAEARLRAHTGMCDICGSPKPGGGGGWHVDHDHITKRIRGILCVLCNHALGRLDAIGLAPFFNYLTKE